MVTLHIVGSEWNSPLSRPCNDVGFPGYRQQNYSEAPLKYILLLCIDHWPSLRENYVSISTQLDILCHPFTQMSEFSRRSKYEVE
jgi:hypothetical protein